MSVQSFSKKGKITLSLDTRAADRREKILWMNLARKSHLFEIIFLEVWFFFLNFLWIEHVSEPPSSTFELLLLLLKCNNWTQGLTMLLKHKFKNNPFVLQGWVREGWFSPLAFSFHFPCIHSDWPRPPTWGATRRSPCFAPRWRDPIFFHGFNPWNTYPCLSRARFSGEVEAE